MFAARLLEGPAHRAGVFVAIAVLYGVVAIVLGVGLVDDSYIFLRYARNVAEGYGPVFNIGDRVEGYTAPLWLLVLVLAAHTPWPLPDVAFVTGGLVGIGALVLVLFSSGTKYWWPAVVGTVFLATHPPFVFWAWSGMDTVLAAGVLLAAVLAAERGHAFLTGMLFGLSILARPDALWFVPALAGLFVWRYGWLGAMRQSWRVIVPVAALVLPHLLWRHAYYGYWVPNTAIAKAGVPPSILVKYGALYLAGLIPSYGPLCVMAIVTARHPRGVNTSEVAPLAACAAWSLLYVLLIGGDHFAFARFAIPAVCLGAVLIGRLTRPFVRTARHAVVACVLVLAVNGAWVAMSNRVTDGRFEVLQARAWTDTGTWFAAHASPDESIATLVAGAIPYYSGLRTYDLLGLVDSTVAREGGVCAGATVGHQRVASDYIIEQNPDYIVFRSSGIFEEPMYADRGSWQNMPRVYWCSLMDLIARPEVTERYLYRAIRLETGRWLEYLERRKESSRR